MFQYTPYKPCRLQIPISTAYNNKYVEYTVSFCTHNNQATQINYWVKIYKGKSLVINGKTDLVLDNILRNYALRMDYIIDEYDNTQRFKPSNYVKALPTDIENVEMLYKAFTNTLIRIEVSYDGTAVITPIELPFNIYQDGFNNPYDTEDINEVHLYNNQIIENHYPMVMSDNYWVCFDYAKTEVSGEDVQPLLYNETEKGRITMENYGNASVAYPIIGIVNYMEGNEYDTIRGGVAGTTIWSETVNGGSATIYGEVLPYMGARTPVSGDSLGRLMLGEYHKKNTGEEFYVYSEQLIGVFDECPKDYYMQWWDKGWHSVSLKSCYRQDTTDNLNITSVYGDRVNIKVDNTINYNIDSGLLSQKVYEEYANGLMRTPYVILYDTANDESHFCTVDTTTFDYRKKKGYRAVTLTLREIINDIR
mgnify:FL=1